MQWRERDALVNSTSRVPDTGTAQIPSEQGVWARAHNVEVYAASQLTMHRGIPHSSTHLRGTGRCALPEQE